ncbi:uncharacterized protein PHALS_06886 [Plasmopara halstedii]|uniref:Uncharacterized protein n=1 Tax=Plasmopara halstedii TaxID=4781 RepID=A0A0P1B482_PLAHL|nr:uncharacterized protein PHALS_06886 [Plasmopara halstedii]CEG49102.1 hypothetical protein PHALS_06886 [Plasmopara halstedii]|eukprot:XP_024585471.1 hypothetical protein PHALS_06886 [Plasmopara halstedii]
MLEKREPDFFQIATNSCYECVNQSTKDGLYERPSIELEKQDLSSIQYFTLN